MSHGESLEYMHNGRRCATAGKTRTRVRKGWGFYNVIEVRYLDEQGAIVDSTSVPAGLFNKSAKPTGRRLFLASPAGYMVLEPKATP